MVIYLLIHWIAALKRVEIHMKILLLFSYPLEYYQITAMQHDAIQSSWSNVSEFKPLTNKTTDLKTNI